MKKRLTLRLKGASPEQLNLKKLSEYLRIFSDMLGDNEKLYFKNITKGSACLNVETQSEEIYQVAKNNIIEFNQNKNVSSRLYSAYQKIEDATLKDGYTAEIYAENEKILVFPKVKKQLDIITLNKTTSIQGVMYNIGGKDNTVPVKLTDIYGKTIFGTTNIQLATELSRYLFQKIRVSGDGFWVRENEEWSLKNINIDAFEVLEDVTIREAVSRLNNIGGNEWSEIDNPHFTLEKMRNEY